MKHRRVDRSEMLFYICMGLFSLCCLIILGWAIAKATGWINSPIWVEMIPLITGVLGAFIMAVGFAVRVGRFTQRFDHLEFSFKDLKTEVRGVKENVGNVDRRLITVETTVTENSRRLLGVERRLTSVERKLHY